MDDLRYPIGKYEPKPFSDIQKKAWLFDLRFLPDELERSIQNLDADQLDTPYREGGWTIKQVVHHVADSHINAYTRLKLGLTEDRPRIKPYNEGAWAMLADIQAIPINISLTLLHALHQRMVATIADLTEAQWQRVVIHPDQQREMSLWFLLGNYAWHGKHHTAHITRLRDRNGW